jgi:hypothetical protein
MSWNAAPPGNKGLTTYYPASHFILPQALGMIQTVFNADVG